MDLRRALLDEDGASPCSTETKPPCHNGTADDGVGGKPSGKPAAKHDR